MRILLAALVALTISSQLDAQTNGGAGAALPSTCVTGSTFVKSGASAGIYYCSATDTWTAAGGSSGAVPAGSIIFIDSGTCPTGYAEATALNGKTIIGTVAANGNVGTTGGSDTLTPAGSNSAPSFTGSAWAAPAVSWPVNPPTFTGAALAAHAHELPWQIPSTTTIRQIAVATFGTGTSRAATAVSAAGTANTTSAAVALSEAKSAGTPAGTIAYPANVPTIGAYTPSGTVTAPTFTGSAGDNRSAFVYVIACKKT